MTYHSRLYLKSLSPHFTVCIFQLICSSNHIPKYLAKPCYITFRQGQQAPHCRQRPRMTRAPAEKWGGERDVFGHPAW
jgi:hypothetical protein